MIICTHMHHTHLIGGIIPRQFLARDVIYIYLALMLRCQCPSVCDGSALAHYIN